MVTRGEVWWVDFGPPSGNTPAKRRPAVIISSDRFNRSAINTVIVAAITSTERLAMVRGNVAVPSGEGGLDRNSVVNVTQVVTVDRRSLIQLQGVLTKPVMASIDDGLRLSVRL